MRHIYLPVALAVVLGEHIGTSAGIGYMIDNVMLR